MEQFLTKTPNPILSVTKDGIVIYSNKAAEPLLHEWGVKVGENLPSNITDLVHGVISLNSPEKLDVKVGNRVYLVVFSPLPQKECVNISGFDITEQREREYKIRENAKKYSHIVPTIQNSNITEGKQAEERIRELANIVESSNDAIITKSLDGIITSWNKGAEQIYGYSAEEILGKYISILEPEDLKGEIKQLADKVEKGERVRHYETLRLKKDGTKINVSVALSPVFDIHGKLTAISVIARDITRRKKAEEDLRKSEALFKAYLENSAVIAWMKDEIGHHTFISSNFEKRFGVRFEDWRGKTDFDLWPQEIAEKFRENDLAVLHGGKSIEVIEETRNSDGSTSWWFNSKFPFVDSLGKKYIGGLGVDITKRIQAEEALRESEERFNLAVKAAQEGVWDWNLETNEVWYSSRYKEMLGYSEDEVEHHVNSWLRLLHPDDKERSLKIIDAVMRGERNYELEFRLRHKDGHYLSILSRGYPIRRESDGKIVRIVGTHFDLTDRKQHEEALRKSEERFRALVMASSEVIYRMSPDWRVMNRLCGRGFLADTEKLNPIWLQEYILPEDQPHVTDVINEVIRQKGVFKLEHRVRQADGSIGWTLSRAVPLLDANNEIIEWFGTASDITERKNAEEALRKSKEQYQTLFNSISEGFANYEAIYDEHGALYDLLVLEINPAGARLLEVEQEALLGKTCREVWPDVENYWFENYKKVDQTGKSVQFEGFSNITGRWYVTQIDRIEKGQFAVIFRDITEEKEAKEALAKYDIAKKKEIHHRIKNNLQIISALLDLQAEKLKGRTNISNSEMLHAFKESQDRVLSMALIHEELYRGGGTDKLNFSSYIGKLAENLILTYRVGNKDISLDMDLEENTFFDIDTAIPLGMIINELVSNSFKYAFQGRDEGEIKIRLLRDENRESKTKGYISNAYILSVSDNGVGIPENIDIQNLDSLGLQLATSLVDQLDGELEIKRSKGTEFTVKFTVTEKDN